MQAKKKPKVKKTQPIVSPHKAMSLGSPKNPKSRSTIIVFKCNNSLLLEQQKELINQKNIQSMQSSSLTPKNLHKQKEGLASKSSTPQKVMEVLKKVSHPFKLLNWINPLIRNKHSKKVLIFP